MIVLGSLLFSNQKITDRCKLSISKQDPQFPQPQATLWTLPHELDLPCQWPVNAHYTQLHGVNEANTALTPSLVSEKPLRKRWKGGVGAEVWEREEGARSKTVWGMGYHRNV